MIKKSKLILGGLTASLLLIVVISVAYAEPTSKVDVRLFDADTGVYHMNNISENALLKNTYFVENQWGGGGEPWNPGGMWVIGGRSDQRVVALNATSGDSGLTLLGMMTYEGEGPIGFRATWIAGNTYLVENQWGGSGEPWNPGGTWLLGNRVQKVVDIDISSNDGGVTLTGLMTYAGEGPIGFRAWTAENTYLVENQWGGAGAPWNPGGMWVIGGRSDQRVVALNATSGDSGLTLLGMMTYEGEGPIGFRATWIAENTYLVENQWGGSGAPWNPGGTWLLGNRSVQKVVDIDISSNDGGVTLTGLMTYEGEGPIGFRAWRAVNLLFLPLTTR
jgi:hypothetical protein